MSATAKPAAVPPPATRGSEALKKFHEEAVMGKAYDGRLLRRLWPFVRPHSLYLVVSLATLVVISSIGLVRPLLMGDVVHQAEASDSHRLLRDGVGLALLLIVAQLLTFVQMYAMQVAGARAMADLRSNIFRFFQRLRLRFYDKTPVGVGLIVNYVRKRSREAYRDVRTRVARLNAYLNEQVNGIAIVQAFVRERAMADEFDAINVDYRDANKRAIYYESVLDAAIEMVSTLCIASILWFAGLRRVGDHAITFQVLIVFTQYIRQFFEPVSQLSQRYTILQSAMAGAERIFQLLDETDVAPPALPEKDCGAPGGPDEAMALEHVDFEYKPGSPVLRDVTFSARRGERIALVGATGAGKTTVSSLLLRLYEPHELRRNFSVVPQDVFLFSGTVLSNVGVADAVPDRARAEEALRRIGALELFEKREGGLDARVDERGQNFSAGERQLIAFARAVYRDAPLLVLDEATASVDSDTEARLQRALEEVMRERTALVIAHRLSTIRAADRIIVFHKGRVVEMGTHDELIAKGAVYARLYRMQFAHEQAVAAERRAHETRTAVG
ncbi:MAG: ABC transporter ATP-binding protein [Polyangiaceae bacterium]